MPKRTTGGAGKRMPMNMRTTAELRRKIDKAAGKSGRSLVQEVEHRVEESFYGDSLEVIYEQLRMICHRQDMLHALVASIIHRLDEQMLHDNGAPMQNGTQPHG
jgi:hypothetical protein